jgi:hypothetical protein
VSLEDARLVTTEKQGRVRTCRLGPRRLAEEAAWFATYRRMLVDGSLMPVRSSSEPHMPPGSKPKEKS